MSHSASVCAHKASTTAGWSWAGFTTVETPSRSNWVLLTPKYDSHTVLPNSVRSSAVGLPNTTEPPQDLNLPGTSGVGSGALAFEPDGPNATPEE